MRPCHHSRLTDVCAQVRVRSAEFKGQSEISLSLPAVPEDCQIVLELSPFGPCTAETELQIHLPVWAGAVGGVRYGGV